MIDAAHDLHEKLVYLARDTTTVVTGGRLIDGTGAPPVENATVVIRGDRIAAVGPAARVQAPAEPGVRTIDARGKTVLPGLIDSHVHFTGDTGRSALERYIPANEAYKTIVAAQDALDALRAGFTTMRVLGHGWADIAYALRKAVAEGRWPGPRLLTAGWAISQTGGHGDPHLLPTTSWSGSGRGRRLPTASRSAAVSCGKLRRRGGLGQELHVGGEPARRSRRDALPHQLHARGDPRDDERGAHARREGVLACDRCRGGGLAVEGGSARSSTGATTWARSRDPEVDGRSRDVSDPDPRHLLLSRDRGRGVGRGAIRDRDRAGRPWRRRSAISSARSTWGQDPLGTDWGCLGTGEAPASRALRLVWIFADGGVRGRDADGGGGARPGAAAWHSGPGQGRRTVVTDAGPLTQIASLSARSISGRSSSDRAATT